MGFLGYTVDAQATSAAQRAAVHPWLRQNVQIFRRPPPRSPLGGDDDEEALRELRTALIG